MSDVGLNFEIWTLPNSAAFKRKADISRWVRSPSLDVRFLDLSSGGLQVANVCPYLDQIMTVDSADHSNDEASLLMVYRDGVWLAAFVVVGREDRSSERQPYTTFSLEGMEWFLERARVRAFDYDANPIREGDWLYGAPSILKTPGGEIANDITNIYRDASVTSGVFKVTDGSTTSTSTVSWDDDGTELQTAVEELTAVTAATVYGVGTEDFPWVIEITDPSGTPFTIAVTDSTLDGDLFVNPIRQGGDYSPRPYHGSVDPVAGVTVGGYEAFELVTPGGDHPASSSDLILHMDGSAPSASGDNPGIQIEANVAPLHRYRSGMRLNAPDSELELRLSVRDLSNNTIATIDYTLNPAQGWVTVPIVDPENPGDPAGIFTMPDVDTVYVRVGILTEEGVNPGSLYLDYLHEGTYLSPGDAAKNLGEIMTDVFAPIAARGVLDWVTTTWTATLDSSGAAWDQDLAVGIRRGQTVYQLLEYWRRWKYEWLWSFDGSTFSLGLFNPGNAGTDYTGQGGPTIASLDGVVDGGVKQFRAPDATYAIAEGDAGHWGEGEDFALATGWGRLESYFANRQNRDGLSTLAARQLQDAALESTGRRVRVQNPSNSPLDAIKIGDTVPTVLSTAEGATDTKSMRVMGITIGQGEEPAPFYDYHLDSMVFEAEAAEADGLRTLIRAYEALDNLGAGSSIDPLFTYQPPPPASVYTEAGNPTGPLTNLRCYTNNTGSTTHNWLIPSGCVAGDGILVFISTTGSGGNGDVTPPAGYTVLATHHDTVENDNRHYVYWKISDGTEADTTFATAGTAEVAAVFGRIPAYGATIPTPDIASPGTVPSTSVIDPPAVTPAAGAGTYHIISAILAVTGDPSPDPETAVSTGYTHLIECDSGVDTVQPHIVIQVKNSTSVVTTEDPGTYSWPAGTGSRWFSMFTLAVAVVSADPDVAPYDHTHVEADITDLDHWTEADHDALDHTGLTGVGGVEDHGALTGLADDDHTQYVLAAGTRAFTGAQSMGSNKLTNVTDPTNAQDAATKAYVDANAGSSLEVLLVDNAGTLEPLTNDAGDDWLYVEV